MYHGRKLIEKHLAYLCGSLSTLRVSIIILSVVSRFIKYALCAACSAISALLTTKNSDDLEIRVPDESRSLKFTPVNSIRVISY